MYALFTCASAVCVYMVGGFYHLLIVIYSESHDQLVLGEPTLEDVIRQHRSEVFREDDETPHRIIIRRDQLLKDALDGVCGSRVEQHQLRITFHGEPGIDDGGLKREFFTLALQKVASNTSLMDGKESRRMLRHNTIAVQVLSFFQKCVQPNIRG